MNLNEYITAVNDRLKQAQEEGDLREFVRLTNALIEELLNQKQQALDALHRQKVEDTASGSDQNSNEG